MRKLPELKGSKVIAFDFETKDPNLQEQGPGTIRNDGYPIGIAIATDTGINEYIPFRHESGFNFDYGQVAGWLFEQFRTDAIKVGFNALYDMEWLRWMGIPFYGSYSDVQTMAALLDEESKSLSLNFVAFRYLGLNKSDDELAEKAKDHGIFDFTKDMIWKLPSEAVEQYAKTDAKLTLELFIHLLPILEKEDLMTVFRMESELLPLIIEMRFRGVRVDLEKAEVLSQEFLNLEMELFGQLNSIVSCGQINVWAAAEIAHAADMLGLTYTKTAKTQAPSFTSAWLDKQEHPFFKAIVELRGINRLRTTFIDTNVLRNAVNGRIHCQFHPMRREEGGTRSGRFSSSNPNLQQVPNEEHSAHAWKIRSLFLPEDGELWAKNDYSQQEPYLLMHYAIKLSLTGAYEFGQRLIEAQEMDFYKMLVELVQMPRYTAKQTFLSCIYGLGKKGLSLKLGKSLEETEEISKQLFSKIPFVKQLDNKVKQKASTSGTIRTIGGRVMHFNDYELNDWEAMQLEFKNQNYPAPLEEAQQKWPNQQLKRAYVYKALNRLLQGSAADMTKMAMLNDWKENKTIPLLQVHDELDHSVANREQAERTTNIMKNAFRLEVPIKVDLKLGHNWGELK